VNSLIEDLDDDQPEPSPDPLGIAAWAASNGLDLHTGLAIASSTLSAVAGSMFRFQLPAAYLGAPGINLAGLGSDSLVAMAIADLTSSLATTQSGLIRKAREFSAEETDAAMYQSGPLRHNQDFLTRLGNAGPLSFGIEDHDVESRMAKDSEVSDQAICYERLVRPWFMLTGSLPTNLTPALGECHDGRGFAGGCIVALPDAASKRHRRVSEIIDHLNGVTFPRKSGKVQINASNVTVFLRGILLFSHSDFDWLIAEHRDLLKNALPIASAATPNAEPEVNEVLAAQFTRLFHTSARCALACRRGHAPVSPMFRTQEAIVEFLRQQRIFLRELQTVPESCRVSEAAKLPATMAWTLLMLAGKTDLDSYIIDTVFVAARRLHADAARLFREHDLANLATQRLTVARKLVRRLAKLGPTKRRELVRGIDKQSLQLHEPIIRVLTDMGIFTESPDRVLEIGLTPLASLSAKQLIETEL
jgi:hypothetical protein